MISHALNFSQKILKIGIARIKTIMKENNRIGFFIFNLLTKINHIHLNLFVDKKTTQGNEWLRIWLKNFHQR